jgi:DNA repair exonuclease SbcCD ATPase subunit
MSTDRTDSALADLLARQAQLRGWIEQLDASADDVPVHVADRVRADYETRLASLVEELRAHESAVRADAERLQDALQLAREEQERAQDELAEGRLRTRLGEWTSTEWDARRGELESRAAAAATREGEIREELERLEELLFEIGEEARPAEPAADPAADDFGFLREVDRLMVEGDGAPPPEEPELDTRPTAGVKCPYCGYTNDATAVYCGVCGVSLS